LFFTHTRPLMQAMVQLLKWGRAPAEMMAWLAKEDARRARYQPCPCGAGRKFKFCHGDKAPLKSFG